MEILQSLINGILLGGIYAAVGIGLSLIFGIVRMVNLAHGDLMILSAYLTLTLMHITGISPYLLLAGVIWCLKRCASFDGYCGIETASSGKRYRPRTRSRAF